MNSIAFNSCFWVQNQTYSEQLIKKNKTKYHFYWSTFFSSKQQEQDTLQTLTAKDSKKLNRSKLFIEQNSNKMGSNRNNHAKI